MAGGRPLCEIGSGPFGVRSVIAQIQLDRSFAPVVGPVPQPSLRVDNIIDKWSAEAAAGATRRFHGYDVSPKLGKDLACQLPPVIGQIEHTV